MKDNIKEVWAFVYYFYIIQSLLAIVLSIINW